MGLNQGAPLPDSEGGLGTDAGEMRFVFLKYIMKTACLHRCEGGPFLSFMPDILAFVLTNRAFSGRCLALSKLGATRGTNPTVHLDWLLSCFVRQRHLSLSTFF